MPDERKKAPTVIQQAKKISEEISKKVDMKHHDLTNQTIQNKEEDDNTEMEQEIYITKKRNKIINYFLTLTKEKIIIMGFIIPPVIISIVSMLHLWKWFMISNSSEGAFVLSLCFELVSIASLLALASLDRITKTGLWLIFGIVALYQIIGNVYASYMMASTNDLLLQQFIDLFWIDGWSKTANIRLIAFIQGAVLPILSLSLLKLAVDYLTPQDQFIPKNNRLNKSLSNQMYQSKFNKQE